MRYAGVAAVVLAALCTPTGADAADATVPATHTESQQARSAERRERTLARLWDDRLVTFEAHAGVGTPVGFAGGAVGLSTRYVVAELGAGIGGEGLQLAAGARLRYPMSDAAVGFGAGVSRGDYQREYWVDAESPVERGVVWRNLDASFEWREPSGELHRVYAGVAHATNRDEEVFYVGVVHGFGVATGESSDGDAADVDGADWEAELGLGAASVPYADWRVIPATRAALYTRESALALGVAGTFASSGSSGQLALGLAARYGNELFLGGGFGWSAVDVRTPEVEGELRGSGAAAFAELGATPLSGDFSIRTTLRAHVPLYELENTQRSPDTAELERETIIAAVMPSAFLSAAF